MRPYRDFLIILLYIVSHDDGLDPKIFCYTATKSIWNMKNCQKLTTNAIHGSKKTIICLRQVHFEMAQLHISGNSSYSR